MANQETSANESGARQVLSARHLVFFVVAAAAPLGFSVGAFPLAIGRGGIGIVGAFLLTGVLLSVFSVGYVTMAQHLTRPGGLYAFVAEGLGRSAGVGASYVAALVYAVAATGAVGAFSVFADAAATDVLGLDLPWLVWAAVGVVAMGTLGVMQVDLNAKVLGVIIVLEVGMLLLVSLAIIFQGGSEGLSAAPIEPNDVFTHSSGAMFAIAFAAFAGFEATVIYSGEVRDRRLTIRRATIAAIGLMALLYGFASWALIMAYGGNHAAAAANADPVNLFFTATNTYLGSWAVKVLEVLVVSSWFASILAFHNATSRYLAAMGRDGLLPAAVGRMHPKIGAPVNASVAHTVFTVAAVLMIVVLGADPYLDLYVLGSTPAVVGIPLLELLASVAILAFFRRARRGHSAWTVLVAPAVASVALAVVVSVIVSQTSLFTGRTGWINVALSGSVFVALVVGTLRGVGMPSRSGSTSTPEPDLVA